MSNRNGNFVLFLFVASMINLVGCHNSYSDPEEVVASSGQVGIINGEPVKNKLWRESVVAFTRIGANNERLLRCTGILIADNFVLTAKHCERDIVRVSFETGNGWVDLKPIRLIRTPPTAFPNHKYANDVLLVEFEGKIPASFRPAKITEQNVVAAGTPVLAMGYGRDENGKSGVLKSTVVIVKSANHEHEYSTSQLDSRTCYGDSGGPEFIEDNNGHLILVGMISGGSGTCSGGAGRSENIFIFRPWILSVISKM